MGKFPAGTKVKESVKNAEAKLQSEQENSQQGGMEATRENLVPVNVMPTVRQRNCSPQINNVRGRI